MKEVYMEIVQNDFNGDHDAYMQELAKEPCKKMVYIDDVACPNCFNYTLHRNETEATCEICGEDFIYIGSILRFK